MVLVRFASTTRLEQVVHRDGLFRAASGQQLLTDLILPQSSPDVYATLPQVTHVDVFISHSWSSSSVQKVLALCLYLNLRMAVKAAVATWIGLSLALVLSTGDPYSLGGTDMTWLTAVLVYLPVGVFVLVLLLGQTITCGRYSPSFWFDRLCVQQADQDLKGRTIAALPVFVANSSRMLVLGDDTYFERLWCNLELAIFAKRSRNPGAVQYQPLWLAPWILSTVLMDVVCITIAPPLESFALDHLTIRIREAFGAHSTTSFFLVLMLTWIFPGMCYLPASLPSFFSHVRKIRQHELLLRHMETFDIQKAKCTLEEDREIIENQVLELFDDPVADGSDSITLAPLSPISNRSPFGAGANSSWTGRERKKRFARFNSYVRGPLRESFLRTIGQEVDMPLSLCLICFMPLIFYSAVSVLGCDGEKCEVTADEIGYDTPGQYVVANALSWTLGFGMIIPTTHPILLRMVKIVVTVFKSLPVQICLTVFCTFLAYAWVFMCQSIMTATMTIALVRPSPMFFLALALQLCLLALQMWYYFMRSRVQAPALQEDCYMDMDGF